MRTTICGAALVLGFLVAGPIHAQTPEVDVSQTANPELVGLLTKEVGVTAAQAEGGAGALLGLAKSRLKPDEFAQVSAAVPGTEGLLKAAPALAMGSGAMAGLTGAGGGLASLAGSFGKLGLKPDAASKFAPVLLKYVNGKGATAAASLLGGVLK